MELGPSRFDPRLRDGGDKAVRYKLLQLIVSIHASVMEATNVPVLYFTLSLFRSTPP